MALTKIKVEFADTQKEANKIKKDWEGLAR